MVGVLRVLPCIAPNGQIEPVRDLDQDGDRRGKVKMSSLDDTWFMSLNRSSILLPNCVATKGSSKVYDAGHRILGCTASFGSHFDRTEPEIQLGAKSGTPITQKHGASTERT